MLARHCDTLSHAAAGTSPAWPHSAAPRALTQVPAPSAPRHEVHHFLEQCSQLGSCTPSPCSSPLVGSTTGHSKSSVAGTPLFRPERQLLGFEPSGSVSSSAGAAQRSRHAVAAVAGFESDDSSSSSSGACTLPEQQRSSSQQATAQRIIAALQPVVQQQQPAAAAAAAAQLIQPALQAVEAAALYQGTAATMVPLCPQPATLGGLPSSDSSTQGLWHQQRQQASAAAPAATGAAVASASAAAGTAAQPAKKRSLLSERLGELRKWEVAVKGWSVPSIGLFNRNNTPQLR
jgi:hypothetical protein